MELLTRRHFVARGFVCLSQGVCLLGFMNWMLSACSSGSSSGGAYGVSSSGNPMPGGNCLANGTPVETTGITESHTHTIALSAADIQAANPNAVFVTSSTGHTHNVQLTAQQYTSLQANQGIAIFTGPAITDGHIHSLTLNCA